jgi:hypothetical protein
MFRKFNNREPFSHRSRLSERRDSELSEFFADRLQSGPRIKKNVDVDVVILVVYAKDLHIC